ncbi:MAG: CoA-binding protein [Candidatus Omnitrophica bacterium]|nr:CoA-binding protein [Candidatus Omnitrophota bacterium]
MVNMDDIKQKKIAVVGVSRREDKYGFKIFKTLREGGYNAEGINPTNGEILGKRIYRSLGELGYAPDLVITVVPHAVTERIVDECRRLGVKEIWMQPGSESEEAIKKAVDAGISVTHNACFMVAKRLW